MKEATGELNVTVITVVAIAAIAALFMVFILPRIRNNLTSQVENVNGITETSCKQNGGTWHTENGGYCTEN